MFQRLLNLLAQEYSSSLVPTGAGWASWAQRLEPGEPPAHPASLLGTGGDQHPEAAALDETAGELAVPEPGVRVAGTQDVDAEVPHKPCQLARSDHRQQEGEPSVVCVQQREIT